MINDQHFKQEGSLPSRFWLAACAQPLIAVPAYGFYYVHDDSVLNSSEGSGVATKEVFMVVAFIPPWEAMRTPT